MIKSNDREVISMCLDGKLRKVNWERTFIKNLNWRTERDTNEMMTRWVEEVSSVRWVNIEENPRDDNSLFFQ